MMQSGLSKMTQKSIDPNSTLQNVVMNQSTASLKVADSTILNSSLYFKKKVNKHQPTKS